jgi:hypothetical protein
MHNLLQGDLAHSIAIIVITLGVYIYGWTKSCANTGLRVLLGLHWPANALPSSIGGEGPRCLESFPAEGDQLGCSPAPGSQNISLLISPSDYHIIFSHMAKVTPWIESVFWGATDIRMRMRVKVWEKPYITRLVGEWNGGCAQNYLEFG